MAKKILVVEDDAVVASYLSDLFTDNGYAAVVARDGETGLELLRSERPDLMTLDIDLPRSSGTILYATMRRDSELRDIPVVVVSGVSPRIKKGLPTLSKPVDATELLRVVADALK